MNRKKRDAIEGAVIMGAILLAIITFPVPFIIVGIFLFFKLISSRR